MILKKPYAFLIKYFKLIHLFVSILMIILIVNLLEILSFLNSYIGGERILHGFDYLNQYFNPFMYFSLAFIVVFSIVMLVLMKKKKKPIGLYIFLAATYLYLTAVVIFSYVNIETLQTLLLDIRVVRANRDFVFAAIALQSLGVIFSLIRSFGFDIRKFDFVKDLQRLEISETDKEEIEVSLSLDKIDPLAEIIKAFHNIRYNFIENKVMYFLFSGVFIFIFIAYTSVNALFLNNTFQQGQRVNGSLFSLNVQESYVTNRSNINEPITENSKFVILKVDMSVSDNIDRPLDNSAIRLSVGGGLYAPTYDYKNLFNDLGIHYDRSTLTSDAKTRLLIFEVFEDVNIRNAELILKDKALDDGLLVDRNHIVRLNPIILDGDTEEVVVQTGETIVLDHPNFSGELTIAGFVPSAQYINRYRYCVRENDCHIAKEITKVPLQRREDDVLHVVTFEKGEEANINLERLLRNHGTFELDGEVLEPLSIVRPNKRIRDDVLLISVGSYEGWQNNKNLVINLRNARYVIEPVVSSQGVTEDAE